MDTITITREAALAVLWFFGHQEGRNPGDFTQHLLEALAHADLTNRAALVAAFPDLGHAFLMAKSDRDGIEKLCQVVAA